MKIVSDKTKYIIIIRYHDSCTKEIIVDNYSIALRKVNELCLDPNVKGVPSIKTFTERDF